VNLEQVRKYALSLPEASEQPHFDATSFRVQGKIFATAPAGGSELNVFVDETERLPLIATEPGTYAPLHWGAKVVGVKVTLATAQSGTVRRLLFEGWKRKAPKRLAAQAAQFNRGQTLMPLT
jgi:hypothetical protein